MKETKNDIETVRIQYEQEIQDTRSMARRILDCRSVAKPSCFRMPWDSRTMHVFDSSFDTTLTALLKDACQTWSIPVLIISEWRDKRDKRTDLEIELLGESPETRKRVRIIDLCIADSTNNPWETKVVSYTWPETALGKVPYQSFRQFRQGVLIADIVIPSLEAITRSLSDRD